MARQQVAVGAAPNDGAGDPLRDAMIKVNNMTAELYAVSDIVYVDRLFTGTSDGSNAAPFVTIQAAVDYVVAIGDAGATKPYKLSVSAGIYLEDVTQPAWIYIDGEGLGVVDIQGSLTPVVTAAGGQWQVTSLTITPSVTTQSWDFTAATSLCTLTHVNVLVLDPAFTLSIIGGGAGRLLLSSTLGVYYNDFNFTNLAVAIDHCTTRGTLRHVSSDAGVVPTGAGNTSTCNVQSGHAEGGGHIMDMTGTIAGGSVQKLVMTGMDIEAGVAFDGAGDGNRTLEFTPGSLESVTLTTTPTTAPTIRERQGDAFRVESTLLTTTVTTAVDVLQANFTGLFPYMEYIVSVNCAWDNGGQNATTTLQLTGDIPSQVFNLDTLGTDNTLPFSYTFDWILGGVTELNMALNMSADADVTTIADANIMLSRKG